MTRLLIVVLFLQPAWARASMIGTADALAGISEPRASQEMIAARQLETLGVLADVARERVQAMSHDEVEQVALGADSLAAGGQVFAVVLILGLVVVVLWAVFDPNAKNAFACFPRPPDRCK